jgi:hypothetical protein
MKPRAKSVGRAQPAWKIQIARRSSSPMVRVVAGGGADGGADGAIHSGRAGDGEWVAMIVIEVNEKGKENNDERGNRMRKEYYYYRVRK